MNPQNPTQQEPIDPQVAALVGAIGKAESGGNYKAPQGKAGEVGAYQMTPAFIQNYAPKYGIDPNSISQDPVAQDKLAYSVIKDWGTNGDPAYAHLGKLSPAEIASAWNAGDPHAYLDPEYGKNNTYGSTQNYVNKIKSLYEQNLGTSGQRSSGIIPTADAAESSPQSSTPAVDDSLWGKWGTPIAGIGAAGLGWLAEHLGGVAKQTLPELGAIGGTAIGGPAGGFVGGGLMTGLASLIPGEQSRNQQQNFSGQPQGQDMSQLFSLESEMPQAQQASASLAHSILQSLQSTPTGRVQAEDPNVKNAILTMGKYGFAPTIENGAMNFSQADGMAKQTISNLSDSVRQILETEKEKGNINEIAQHAKENVRRYSPSNDWEEADKHIDDQVQRYAKNFGDKQGNMFLSHIQRMKQETGHGQKFGLLETSAKKNAFKALSAGARQTIEKHTRNKEFYNAAMKEEQSLINARKIIKRLNGKKAPRTEAFAKKHELLTLAGKSLGAYVGNKIGGPMGAVLGYLTTRHIIKAADKRYGKSIFETPEIQRGMQHLQHHHPAVFHRIAMELQKAGWKMKEEKKKQGGLLRLTAGPIPLGSKSAPSESVVVGGKRPPLSLAQAKKRKAGRPEYGGIYEQQKEVDQARKAAGITSRR